MKGFQAFTLKGTGLLRLLQTDCFISDAFDIKPGAKQLKTRKYTAIWDTGATTTVITKKIAKELGLKPSGFTTVSHAQGISDDVNTYLVNVYLPNKIAISGVRVCEGVLEGNVDVLIGMDIIRYGDFSITNVKGKSCFSFRIPSIKEVDFVQEANAFKKTKTKYSRSRGYKGGKKGRR